MAVAKNERMEVSVDADLCGGCGKCVNIAPEIFTHVDGISRVKWAGFVLDSGEVAVVSTELQPKVLEAAEQCPGEIILVNYIEAASLPETRFSSE